jgi:rhodanese-related sulfurtransferase
MKDNWLNKLMIAAGLFAIIIIIGLMTMQKPKLHYKLTEKETLAAMCSKEGKMSPYKANEIQLAGNPQFQFIDIRTPYEFIKGHIARAINIPLSSLFSKENYDFFKQADKENHTLILYGVNESQANAPWMLMKQLGLNKVLVLQGGYVDYSLIQPALKDSIDQKICDSEIARHNFSEMVKGFAKTDQVSSKKITPQKVITKPKSKSTSPAAGGC